MNVEFRPVQHSELEPFRAAARREHSGIDPLPSIRWFAAVSGTDILGCIGLLHASRDRVRVRGWYVRPDHRGQGLGMWLQECANDWARDHGYRHIESTTRLWRVLERHGWSVLRPYTEAIGTKMTLDLADREGR